MAIFSPINSPFKLFVLCSNKLLLAKKSECACVLLLINNEKVKGPTPCWALLVKFYFLENIINKYDWKKFYLYLLWVARTILIKSLALKTNLAAFDKKFPFQIANLYIFISI